MKTSSFPPLRVTPEVRAAAEDVLGEGESLSAFVESSIRAQIARRQAQREFIARGLASLNNARRGGGYIAADDVLAKLEDRLARAKAASLPKRGRKAKA